MSEAKFTKGEWKVSAGHYNGMLDINCGGKMNLIVVTTATDITWHEGLEREANAHLIACAPEMYAMLESIIAAYEMDWDDTEKVIKLLAKARGDK